MRALLLVALTATTAAADPTLDKIEAVYAKAKQVTGAFTKKVVNKTFGKEDVSQGTFAVERPDKLRFDFVDKKAKPRSTWIFDGATGRLIDHMNKKVEQRAMRASDLPSAVVFLTGKKGVLAQTHAVTTSGTTVTLTPNKPQAAYGKIELVFDPATHQVTRTIVSVPDLGPTTYEFSKVNLAAKLPAGVFAFDPKKHPNYAVKP